MKVTFKHNKQEKEYISYKLALFNGGVYQIRETGYDHLFFPVIAGVMFMLNSSQPTPNLYNLDPYPEFKEYKFTKVDAHLTVEI